SHLFTLSLHDALPISQHPFSLRRRAISAATASSSLGLPSTARHWFIFTPIGDQASRSCSTVAAAPVPSRFTSTTYRARSLLTSRSEEHTSELQSRFDL